LLCGRFVRRATFDRFRLGQKVLEGQPHRSTIATTLFRDKIQQLRS